MERPSLLAVAKLFCRVGSTTFGSGGATMIRLGEASERAGWTGPAQFDLMFTLARIVPGTNVFAFVMGMGYAVRGWPGAIVALLSLSFPAASVVIILTIAYQACVRFALGRAFVTGAMASIVGVIVGASWLLLWMNLKKQRSVRPIFLAAGGALLTLWLSPLQVLLTAAAIGYFWQEDT